MDVKEYLEEPGLEVAESNWDRGDTINLIVIFLLIIAVGGMVYFAFKLTDETAKCVSNPIEYYHSLGNDKCFCLSGIGGEESPLENCPKVNCNAEKVNINVSELKEKGIIP